MKNLIRICLFTMLLFVTGDLAAQNIHLSTPRTSLVLSAPAGGELKYVYYGSKLTENDCREVYNAPTMQHGAYPVYGMNCPGESALAVTHADGNMTLQMEVAGTEIKNTDGAVTAVIKLKDKVYPFSVNVCYKARRLEGKSYKEIAEQFGIPQKKVDKQLQQAVTKLRRALKDFFSIIFI